jgi:uroporphyrinogen III methyltransferase/synthase
VTNPAIIIVGDVVRLREHMAWFDTQPLFGKRILVPRPAEQASATARAIRERGAEALVEPAIVIGAPPDPEALSRAVLSASSYDWVLFTSANGVRRFFEAVDSAGRDARVFGSSLVAVIGPKTAEALRERGIVADVVAREYIAESLVEELLAEAKRRKMPRLGRVLLARALMARDVVPTALEAQGAAVDVVAAYETHGVSGASAEQLRARVERDADIVLFTSSSMVTSLVEALGESARELLGRLTVACIGPVTRDTALSLGLRVDVEASVYTVEGLLDALEAHALVQRAS